MTDERHVVTGAFGYSGRYIVRRLLRAGQRVRTLTNSPPRADLFDRPVEVRPLDFTCPARLVEALRGAAVLYNTYWVRFNHARFTHAEAVRNMGILFDAAQRAGVRRIVHVSITNPDVDSPLTYFSGKARLERALLESGVSCAILRPTVLFGCEDVLINNIAWMLRRFPIFGVFGRGDYRLQPIYVDDLAELAVREGAGRANVIVDAIGPETFTYRQLVETIGRIIGKRRPIVSLPPKVVWSLGWLIGKCVGDVVIVKAEIEGLMAERLYVESPPAGQTRLTEWAGAHADVLGRRYTSELARRR